MNSKPVKDNKKANDKALLFIVPIGDADHHYIDFHSESAKVGDGSAILCWRKPLFFTFPRYPFRAGST